LIAVPLSLRRVATSRKSTGIASCGYTSTPWLVAGMSTLSVIVRPSNAARSAPSFWAEAVCTTAACATAANARVAPQ
jgi:hypothetical protein